MSIEAESLADALVDAIQQSDTDPAAAAPILAALSEAQSPWLHMASIYGGFDSLADTAHRIGAAPDVPFGNATAAVAEVFADRLRLSRDIDPYTATTVLAILVSARPEPDSGGPIDLRENVAALLAALRVAAGRLETEGEK